MLYSDLLHQCLHQCFLTGSQGTPRGFQRLLGVHREKRVVNRKEFQSVLFLVPKAISSKKGVLRIGEL